MNWQEKMKSNLNEDVLSYFHLSDFLLFFLNHMQMLWFFSIFLLNVCFVSKCLSYFRRINFLSKLKYRYKCFQYFSNLEKKIKWIIITIEGSVKFARYEKLSSWKKSAEIIVIWSIWCIVNFLFSHIFSFCLKSCERESICWIESFDRNKLCRDSEDFSSNLLQFAYSFRWPPKEFNRNIFCVFTLTLVRNVQSNFLDRNKCCCCTCERVSDHFKSIFGVEKSTQIKTEFEMYILLILWHWSEGCCEMNFYLVFFLVLE